jgi:hypothetical protein
MVEKTIVGKISELKANPDFGYIYDISTDEILILPARSVITNVEVQLNDPKPIIVTQINDRLSFGIDYSGSYIEMENELIENYLNKNSVSWISLTNKNLITPVYFDFDLQIATQSFFTDVPDCDIYYVIKYKEFLTGDRKQ